MFVKQLSIRRHIFKGKFEFRCLKMEKFPKKQQPVELEDQFLLRLPKDEAKYIRNLLHSKPKKIKRVLQLELSEDLRSGTVYIKKKALPAKLVDTPAIVESLKTFNGVNFYKTGTICQLLHCGNIGRLKDEHKYPCGLTPPMKNCKKFRFRKTMKNHEDIKEAADIQKEVALLLRTDYDAVASRYEVLACSALTPEEEITETMLFGTLSASDSDASSSTSLYDIMEFNN